MVNLSKSNQKKKKNWTVLECKPNISSIVCYCFYLNRYQNCCFEEISTVFDIHLNNIEGTCARCSMSSNRIDHNFSPQLQQNTAKMYNRNEGGKKKEKQHFIFAFFVAFYLVSNTKYTGHGIYKSCSIIYDHNTLSCLMLIWKVLVVNRRRQNKK